MRVEIPHEAEEELNPAIGQHEKIESGLGVRLKAKVHAMIQWIGANPESPRLRPKRYRRW